jgi:hypothetical protein
MPKNAVRARIYYQIDEKICERGEYLINSKKIRGYRNYYYKSAMWLSWKLPRSQSYFLKSIKRWQWKFPGIVYDKSKMDLEKRYQDHFDDFTLDNKHIKGYEKFHGLESTIVTQLQNKCGPSEIKIYFDNGEEIELDVRSKDKVLKELQKILN